MSKNIKVIYSELLSTLSSDRYIVVNTDTGEVVADAQGYGYKSPKKAYSAWYYKHPDKLNDNSET